MKAWLPELGRKPVNMSLITYLQGVLEGHFLETMTAQSAEAKCSVRPQQPGNGISDAAGKEAKGLNTGERCLRKQTPTLLRNHLEEKTVKQPSDSSIFQRAKDNQTKKAFFIESST